ncbi:MAG: HAD family hydrolase [Halobaculum sp.]
MSYDAVFFDLDDTLYPYSPCNEAGKRAAHERLSELGYDLDRAAFEEFYATGRRDVKRELSGTASTHERFLYFKRALERHTGTAQPGDAHELGAAFWDGYLAEMSLFDGVRETLSDLRAAGVEVAVVTNLTTRIQLRKLAELGLDEEIDLLLTSEETGREKPGSVMFTLPLARLGVTPAETLMVGDSIQSDVVGGNAAGLTTVLVNNDDDERAVAERPAHERPDHHLDSVAAVPEVAL